MTESYIIPDEDILGYNIDQVETGGEIIPGNSIYVTQSLFDMFEGDVTSRLQIGNVSPKILDLRFFSEEEFDKFSDKIKKFLACGKKSTDNKKFIVSTTSHNPTAALLLKMSM